MMTGFIFLFSKVTADGDLSHEFKTLVTWKESYDQCGHIKTYVKNMLKHVKNNILKSRDITLLTKVRLVKAMVFPLVMYRCESCTIKKAEW